MSTSGLLCEDLPEAWHAARACRGLKEGIVVKRVDGSFRRFGPEDLKLMWYDGSYGFVFRGLGGFVRAEDYKVEWAFGEKEFR